MKNDDLTQPLDKPTEDDTSESEEFEALFDSEKKENPDFYCPELLKLIDYDGVWDTGHYESILLLMSNKSKSRN